MATLGQVFGGLMALSSFASLPIFRPNETLNGLANASQALENNDSTDKKVARVLAVALSCICQFASALGGIAAGVHIFTMTPQAGFFASLLSSREVIKPYVPVFLGSLTAATLSHVYGNTTYVRPQNEAGIP